ncbi:type I polyketide synthase [Streptomyces sp. RTd22]|uniref:type I polyketide synthase n=1 Tax=Streptomyces sp. RTd22 TaxID=1841249 RepID=UPI000A947C75|nr:type I polyketide synthase [Streptomyces sp. RTd22]
MTGRHQMPPVAIVGMSVLLPGSPDLDTYWRNLTGGVDAITEVPAGRWDTGFYDPRGPGTPAAPDRVYCRRGGFVDTYAQVEAARFGIMPNSVSGTEPDQLIALGVAAAALADAGGDHRLPDRERVGVVLGRGGYLTPGLVRLDQRVRTAHQLVRTLGELLPGLGPGHLDRIRDAFTEQLGPDRPEAAIGLVPNLAASRIANRLDLRGPAYTVDAACASSLVAVDQAVGELASGRCDVMLAGGVHHCHDITLWSVFAQLRALSPSQRIRPFDRAADGLLIGEGTGVVVLKRLADARRDGDRVYAVIRGTGVASDGRATGLVNPDPGGQTRAVRQAWRAAGLDPRAPGSIGLLEAHGTATPAGDAAELTTLAEAFGPGSVRDSAVIGSVKSMIGHTMPAAGVAGLVKAALAVHHGWLLPTLHCDDPHPGLSATRFRTLDAATPWEAPVRRAAVNAFGFGGINAHVVLEQEPTAPVTRRPATVVAEPERVLALAVDTPERLAELLAADDATVRATAPAVGSRARTRLGIVDPTAKRLALARRVVAKGRPWRGRNDVWFTTEPLLATGGKLAFVFPGLEADFEPRTDGIAEYFGLSRHTGDRPGERYGEAARAGDIGRHGVGVFGVGRLLNAALGRMGIVPDAVAGHSVGEWSAMAAGGLYAGEAVDAFLDSFDPDALRVPGVTFAVLGTGAERVLTALAERPDRRIVLSHDNAPSQSMVCGPRSDVEEFVQAMRATGVIAQVLPFQSGFHTPMLAPFLDPIRTLAERFELLLPSRVPVWSGTTAAPYPQTEAEVRELFVRHLLEPVRFRLLTQALHDAGFRAFVQMGTGQLASLIGDTLQGRDHVVVAANSPHRDGVAQLRRVATALWTEGAPVDPALPRPGAARRSAPVRLNLDGALVSLGGARLAELRGVLAAGLSPTPPLPETGVLRPPAPQPTPAVGPLYAAVAPDASNVAPPYGATAGPHHPAPLPPQGAGEAAASHPAVPGSQQAAWPHAASAGSAHVAPPHLATADTHHLVSPSTPGSGQAEVPHPAVAGSQYAASPHVATAAGDYVPAAGSAHAAMAGTHHLVPPSPPGTGQPTASPTAVAGSQYVASPHGATAGADYVAAVGSAPAAPPHGATAGPHYPAPLSPPGAAQAEVVQPAVAGSQYAVPPNAATAGADYVAVAGTHPAAGSAPAAPPQAVVAGPHHLVPPYPPGADNVGAAGSRPAAVPQAPASPYPAAGAAPAASPHVAAVGTGQAAPPLPTAPDAASARPVAGAAHAAPWAAELDALLRETADAAAELVAAGRARPVVARGRTYDVRVSSEAMPYLRDHCFFPQRPGWPDEADRWPVVPATTIVQHLIDAAEHTADGRHVAVAVHGARFDQWVTATPPSTVPVTVTPSATDPAHYTVTFGRSARGVVQLAPRYPDAADRPAPWRIDPATERIPEHTAAQIYDERWMFHGPAFQGLTRLTAIGEMQVRGTITTPAAPGALLDNVGQLLGYWIMATRTERSVVFPVGMRLMRFYGPPPRPGTEVECLVRIVALTDAALEADVQLLIGGEVWAELHGWHDRRFDNDPQTRPVERFPQRNTLSQPQPGGWSLVYERWPDLASRDLIMRNHLGGAERAEYARQPPLGRRQWLLGRIAAKDAVRRWLWEQGEGPVFPAEIRVCEDEHGRPYAVGLHGRTLPPLDLRLAHRAEAGVALVAPRHQGERRRPGIGIGIGIEEVTERDVAFDPAERALLTTVTASGGASATWWAAAFRAAKEAVAKADGTGRDTAVVGAEHTHLTVEAATAPGHPPRRYRVRCTTTANPSGLPGREYAVAWTTGPGHRDQDEETDQ